METHKGTITIEDGNNENNIGVITSGKGNVLLKTNQHGSVRRLKAIEDSSSIILNAGVSLMNQGEILLDSQGELIVNSDINAISGEINLTADKNIFQNANILLSEGQINVKSLKGTVEMSNGSKTSITGSGSIFYSAEKDISISVLNSNQEISVNSISGEILDQLENETPNIISQKITMTAALGIGTSDDINTNASKFDIQNSGENGDIFISDTGYIDDIEINQLVQKHYESDGDIKFKSLQRSIKLVPEGKGVATKGTGDIMFNLQGEDADMIVDAPITTEAGNLNIEVKNNLEINVPYETGGEVTMNVGNNYGNTSGNMYRSNNNGVTTFMWQEIPGAKWYSIAVKKDGIIHYRDVVYNDTKWTPTINLDWKNYQLTAEPTIIFYRNTRDLLAEVDETIHFQSNYLNELNKSELPSDSLSLYVHDIRHETNHLDNVIINWSLFDNDYPQATYQIEKMNKKDKLKVNEDCYLTTKKGITYKLDSELAGKYVEIKYSLDNQQMYVIGPDGFIYGPYNKVETKKTPSHQNNKSESKKSHKKDFKDFNNQKMNSKETGFYKFLEKDLLYSAYQENKPKRSKWSKLLDKNILFSVFKGNKTKESDEYKFLEKDFLYPINGNKILFSKVTFDEAQFHTSSEFHVIFEKITSIMSKNPKCMLYIEVHGYQKTSNDISKSNDLLISEKKIRQYLMDQYNINSKRIRIFLYGSKELQSGTQANCSYLNLSLVEYDNVNNH